MKNMKKMMAILLTLTLALSFTACGGKEKEKPVPDETMSKSGAAAESSIGTSEAAVSDTEGEASGAAGNASIDYSSPSIVIEFGDLEGIVQLGKDMQNFAVEEGTVIKITGLISRNFDTPSIMEAGDGGKNGISMFLDDMSKEEYPEADTRVEAVGTAQKGEYFMEFHVLKENLKVESAEEAESPAQESTEADSDYGKSTADATGYVDRDTLKAAVIWCREKYSEEVKPDYEEVREHFGGVDGKKYESSWNEEEHKYKWMVEGAPNGKDYILVTFTVESDGTEVLKQNQYDPELSD